MVQHEEFTIDLIMDELVLQPHPRPAQGLFPVQLVCADGFVDLTRVRYMAHGGAAFRHHINAKYLMGHVDNNGTKWRGQIGGVRRGFLVCSS